MKCIDYTGGHIRRGGEGRGEKGQKNLKCIDHTGSHIRWVAGCGSDGGNKLKCIDYTYSHIVRGERGGESEKNLVISDGVERGGRKEIIMYTGCGIQNNPIGKL